MAEPDRSKWLEQRRSGLGGTDSPRVMGISSWGDAYCVYMEKTGLITRIDDNPHMKVGRAMEPVIARMYAEKYHIELDKGVFMRHAAHKWLVGTTDYHIRGARAGMDCKMPQTPRAVAKWGKPETDEVPLEYFGQAQHYLLLTGWDAWYLAALLPADGGGDDEVDVQRYVVEPDKEYQQMLVEECGNFWRDHVEAGVCPAPTSKSVAREYLKARHPSEKTGLLSPTDDLRAKVAAYREIRRVFEESKVAKEDWEAYLKFLIGDALGFDFGSEGKITWKKSRDTTSTDWQSATREILTTLRLDDAEMALANEIIAKHTSIVEGGRRFHFGLKEAT